MALYRATGRKQESVDIRGGMYQTTLNYFLEAWAKAPQSPHPEHSSFPQTACAF